jgi:hypothetical protein
MNEQLEELNPQASLDQEPSQHYAQKEEWRPTAKEALREYEINIRFLNRGCIVRVGCKEIAFEDYTSAMLAINKYVNSPWEEQQRWRKLLD